MSPENEPENKKEPLGADVSAARETPSRPRQWIAGGLGLGVGALIVSWILGTCFFPDAYYTEWLIVAAMGLYFLIAWLIHLRDDGIMKPRRETTRRQKTGASDTGKALVVGAFFLALASLALYFYFGVGRAFGG